MTKWNGKGTVLHTDVIGEADMKILGKMQYKMSVKLQWKVWFLLQIHFAKCSNDNVNKRKKSELQFNTNAKDECIQLIDNITKNHCAGDLSSSYGGPLQSTGHGNCLVKIVKLYLQKLPPINEYLW
jgi:hypothetical protein